MDRKSIINDILITIPITFIVAAITTFVYSLIAYDTAYINWETSFNLAIVFGIVLPLTRNRLEKKK